MPSAHNDDRADVGGKAVEPHCQDEVFALLADARIYPCDSVRRFDTHTSVVFLAGDRAYKIKRAVQLPFVDYSTIAQRKAACETELRINQRFAPQLYRRVVPITREADGRLRLAGTGTPVEWALEMVRFDENLTLDQLAERHTLPEDLAERLAQAIADMHVRAEPADADAWIAALSRFVQQNTAVFAAHARLFPPDVVAELDARSVATLAHLHPLLAERGRLGLVRRGHGDLHLRNIALLDGEPVAFDALEFDPVIASGDLLYDLAFLLMDLVERGLVSFANRVLNGYFVAARRIDDYDGIAALPFFMSLRAAIRANVTAVRIDQTADGETALMRPARDYFQLAVAMLRPATPRAICIGGLSGTGKSVLARALAPLLSPSPGALVLRSDIVRKVMFNVAPTVGLSADAYRSEISERVYRVLGEKAARALRAGCSVIVDAVFARADERAAIAEVVRAAGAECSGIFLTADLATRIARVGSRRGDASDADAAIAREQEAFDVGALDWAAVDASGTPEATLANVRRALSL